MAHDKKAGLVAKAKHQEAIFRFRVFFVKELHRELIVEDRTSLLEGNPVLL